MFFDHPFWLHLPIRIICFLLIQIIWRHWFYFCFYNGRKHTSVILSMLQKKQVLMLSFMIYQDLHEKQRKKAFEQKKIRVMM